ncbi:hypothetical protein MVEG_10566 [Podila verticillata NRRL 6337]|nr:hypothetical protein MVEG_10566 [Podila verticillata NRRL 6337]
MLATQQESFMTHHPHTHHPHHMLTSNTGRQLGFSANSILMDQKASLEKLESRKSVDRMRAASDVLPHSRPQALVQAHLLAQGQPSTQAPTPSTPQVKHQRRRSFLPSALMTSNLAKFVSGQSNSPLPTSPASAQSPQSSQSATSRSSPLKLEEEPTSQILTVDQFKWSVGCCCHEIKSKAMKQRSLTKDQQSQTSIPGATPSPLPSPPTPRKHEWTKPRRYTNSSPPPPRDDSKDARPVLQALLQVMATTQESTQDLGSSSRLSDSLYGQSPHSSQMRLPQQPSRNHSLLSFMGSSASSNALPAPFPDTSSSPLRQYQTYEISVSNARPQTIESQRFSWTPSAHSLASHISSPVESLDRSRHLSPSIATSTDSNPYPGCEAILGPMTVQDLVRLLAFILSVAPEQWIPWHLYDFFVRPQGRTYRDLVELLPTQSQKVLRTILATVDLLVDFAVATERQQISSAHSSTPVSSAGKVPGAHLRSKSDAFDSRDAMATVSEHASFGSMAESTLEQQPVNTTDPSKRNTSGGEILSTANVNAATIRSEILSQRMQVIRGLKRTAIIDHLSDSVFRSRQDVAMQMYGYPSSPSPGRESPSFNLRRSSMPSPRPRASTIAVPQGSELERASALQAFENLVSAYEDEYYPRRSKVTTQPLSTSGTLEDTEARDHGEMRPSLMLLSRSLSSTAPRSGSGSEPGSRHMRTPTSFSPIPESDASNSRSLSLPPWRKQSPLAMTTESRRPKLESSVSSPGPSSQEVSRVPLIESKSAVGLVALGADLLKREALIQPVPQPPQLAPLRLLILEEEEILIRDTSDEESFSEGEGMDDEEIEGELRDHDDTCLGQRSSRLAMDATEEAERDADNKARDEDLRDLLAQGLSLLKYKRKRRLKKESSTFGDLTVYDQWGGEGGGGPSGPTKPQASEQDIDDDADISENEV